jgi:two-component system chemotaxis response regulator CheB
MCISPRAQQMKIVRQSQWPTPSLLMTDDPPENYCKPSVDYLFRSIAHLYANRALGVIMTGMGADGVRGLRLMKKRSEDSGARRRVLWSSACP